MSVLSIDLASRRYRDNGIALLHGAPGRVTARLVDPESLGLHGEPAVAPFVSAIAELAERERVRVILLDGPQAWRANESSLVHLRHCERETRTPGKTGPPGVVKPQTWTRMAEFSIALFDALHERGWPRLTDRWQGGRAAVESFPTHAWRMLGHTALPGKSATTTLAPWLAALTDSGLALPMGDIGHDEVQALVAGLAGIAMVDKGLESCDVRGINPFLEDGAWREGFIVSPRPGTLPRPPLG
jgi:hypothetical protein